jgi:membrane associated rhomboid family serine protease
VHNVDLGMNGQSRSSFPLLTCLFVILNGLVYILELEAGSRGARGLCDTFGLVPVRFAHGGSIWTLVSSAFLHDPNDVWHLVGNVAFLAVFGVIVEGALGHAGFLAVYLIAAVAGGLLHVHVDPASMTPLVGASGAIFGLIAVAAAIRPPILGFAVAFAGLNVWHALVGADGTASFGCHIGGFTAGVAIAALIKLSGSDALEEAA